MRALWVRLVAQKMASSSIVLSNWFCIVNGKSILTFSSLLDMFSQGGKRVMTVLVWYITLWDWLSSLRV